MRLKGLAYLPAAPQFASVLQTVAGRLR